MTAMSKWTSFTLFGEALAKCGGSPVPPLLKSTCAGTTLIRGVSSRTSTRRTQRRERSEGAGDDGGGRGAYRSGHCLSVVSREERRWLEKQNKAQRLQLKREEMARIRALVGEHSALHACEGVGGV